MVVVSYVAWLSRAEQRPLIHRVLEAEVPNHGIIGGHQVEVRDAVRPDGTLVRRHNFVLDREAVGVLQPQGNDPRLST